MPIHSSTGPVVRRRIQRPVTRRRIGEAPLELNQGYGDPNMNMPDGSVHAAGVDMSGNQYPAGAGPGTMGSAYYSGTTGRRSDQAGRPGPQVIQVQGQAQPQTNLVLQPGSPEVLTHELTTGQTGIIYGVPQAPIVMISDPSVINLYKKYYTTYEEYRKIRKDPTVALCRAVIAAPILSSTWQVRSKEGVDAERVAFITDMLVKHRFHIMEKAIYGMVDFGWQGFEKVFGVDMWTPPVDRPADTSKDADQPTLPPAPAVPDGTSKTNLALTLNRALTTAMSFAFGDKTNGSPFGNNGKNGDGKNGDKPKMKPKKMIVLRKIKPLLQDMTSIMVYLYTGDFAGFRQGIVFVEAPAKAVLISYRVEGTMWHGYPLLEQARETVEKWDNVEVGAQRYDQKIAGSHFVVYYPMGTSNVSGQQVNNADIASDIIKGLEAGGSMSVPNILQQYVEGMEAAGGDERSSAWKIDFLEDRGARQSSFVDRLKYLDSLKCRAMNIPERAITEGQFGTKAEAQGHADIMTVILQNLDMQVTQSINNQVVDHLLALNYGKDAVGTVWLESSPISDDRISYARSLFTAMLTNQQMGPAIFPHIDFSALMQEVEVPRNKDVVRQMGQAEVGQLAPGGSPAAPAAHPLTPGVGAPPAAPAAGSPAPGPKTDNPQAEAAAKQAAAEAADSARQKALAQQMGLHPGQQKTILDVIRHMRAAGTLPPKGAGPAAGERTGGQTPQGGVAATARGIPQGPVARRRLTKG